MEPGGPLFYDKRSMISYSKNLKLEGNGYNPSHVHENQVTVTTAFSVKSWVAVAMHMFTVQ